MWNAAAPNVACPDGYAGNGGVKFLLPVEFVRGAPKGNELGSQSLSMALVPNSRWPRGVVLLADTQNRSPKIVDVLLIPRQDASVGHRDVH